MRINADFSKPALVTPRVKDWICSPESGVERLMLDRIGDEVARATSIVRYAPGSSFSRHQHAKGEEFLVLEGIFSDENGDYPSGTYVRNPPGSSHAPYSKDGCRILVKLRQFEPDDLVRVVVDTRDRHNWQAGAEGSGGFLPLHAFRSERVVLLRVPAGSEYPLVVGDGGMELFVVRGELSYTGRNLTDECWLRLPAGSQTTVLASADTIAWIKTGHLPAG